MKNHARVEALRDAIQSALIADLEIEDAGPIDVLHAIQANAVGMALSITEGDIEAARALMCRNADAWLAAYAEMPQNQRAGESLQ